MEDTGYRVAARRFIVAFYTQFTMGKTWASKKTQQHFNGPRRQVGSDGSNVSGLPLLPVPGPVPGTERFSTLENSRQQDVGEHLILKDRRKVRYYLTGQKSLRQTIFGTSALLEGLLSLNT